ncbi:MAG TPA: helix-turn-helix transcriptional regulator [Bryobacteraceae bacterium]|nr:helix-turn-helix transcriptional regulator [Bryobacteraceae bacterium]
MEDAGRRLREARDALHLTTRQVEEASRRIAERRANRNFAVTISFLSDIETQGALPNVCILSSLSAIYRLDLEQVLSWYGIDKAGVIADSQVLPMRNTHLTEFRTGQHGSVQLPHCLDPGIDSRRTTYLSRVVQKWGPVPLMLLQAFDPLNQHYGFIGTDDWNMYPLLAPGALVLIDISRRDVAGGPWSNDFQRPIWFLRHDDGYECCWCALEDGRLTLTPHPSSGRAPRFWKYPGQVRVVGQVVAVAMPLDPVRRRPLSGSDEP